MPSPGFLFPVSRTLPIQIDDSDGSCSCVLAMIVQEGLR